MDEDRILNGELYSDRWHEFAHLRPALLGSVVHRRQRSRGVVWHILSGPGSRQQLRLNDGAWRLVGMLDGSQELDRLWHRLLEGHGNTTPSQPETLELLARLSAAGFLRANVLPDLPTRIEETRRIERRRKIAALSSTEADSSPRLSGDGLTIYITSQRTGGTGSQDIYVSTRKSLTSVAWTTPVEVSELNSKGTDCCTTFDKDDLTMIFVSNRGGSAQIYVMSSSGGGVRRLTFQGNYNQEPDWNPKPGSNLIAFTGRDGKGAYDIFTVDAKKGTIKRLTQGQGSCRSPTWSPNGRLVAYETTRGGIWVMDDEGLNQHQLKRYGTSPAWSR